MNSKSDLGTHSTPSMQGAQAWQGDAKLQAQKLPTGRLMAAEHTRRTGQ